MKAVRHLGVFFKFEILTVDMLKRIIIPNDTELVAIRRTIAE